MALLPETANNGYQRKTVGIYEAAAAKSKMGIKATSSGVRLVCRAAIRRPAVGTLNNGSPQFWQTSAGTLRTTAKLY